MVDDLKFIPEACQKVELVDIALNYGVVAAGILERNGITVEVAIYD